MPWSGYSRCVCDNLLTAFVPLSSIAIMQCVRPRATFAYIDESIVDCRLRGIYNLCRKGNFVRAHENARDTLILLYNAPIIEIAPTLYHDMVAALQWINHEFVLGDYRNVHTRVRDLHYKIMEQALQ